MSAEVTLKFSSAKELFEMLSKIGIAETTFETLLERIHSMSGSMAEQLDILRANVTRLDGLEDRVKAFRDAVPGLIQEAVDAARAEGATPAQLVALRDLNASISAELDALAGSVPAEQPPGELPPPVEPPPPGTEPVTVPPDGTTPPVA